MLAIGINDEEFIRGEAPMTKQEIRILSLAKARIHPQAVVFDIGSGTGSIAIEAARLAPEGHVYALERTAEGAELIHRNADKFNVHNISIMETEAPDGMEHLPMADAVFIGGSGGHLLDILASSEVKLHTGGRIVVNCITAQSLSQCIDYMRGHKRLYSYEAIQVQVTRMLQVGDYDMAKALNPVYIVTCSKL